MKTTTTRAHRAATMATVSLLALGLAACSSDSGSDTTGKDAGATSSAPAPESTDGGAHAAVTISGGWAKAADKGMSAGFGMLKNTTGNEVTINGATSDVSPMVELHEMVPDATGQMVMRKVTKPLTIPANGTLELKPGGNHIMFMDLKKPLAAGENVSVTLQTSAGDVPLELPVRPFTGANETYMPGSEHPQQMPAGTSTMMHSGH